MPSIAILKLKKAGKKVVVMDQDGKINFPFTNFLNTSNNINTQSTLFRPLSILHSFLMAYQIKLADRSVEGICLERHECEDLCNLCYRPSEEISSLSPERLRRLNDPTDASAPQNRPKAVAGPTASKRVYGIIQFLKEYRKLIDPCIRSADTRARLENNYSATCSYLDHQVGGSVAGNPSDIRSLPAKRFEQIMKAVYLRPTEVFQTADQPTQRPERDSAMTLLGCEGLRAGEIGNIKLGDLYTKQGTTFLTVKSNTKDREAVTTETPRPKGDDSTRKTYSTERTIKLWPWTAAAIKAYENGERRAALSSGLRDKSRGFLFLKSTGEPIGSRRTISLCFQALETGLLKIGLLSTEDDLRYEEDLYDVSAHPLRHSAAAFFLECKTNEGQDLESTKDQMRTRFGWTPGSDQPNLYANRAIVDRSDIILMDLWDEMKSEAKQKLGTKAA